VLAASADPSFQLGKLGLFITGEGDWVRKDVTRFEPGFSSDAGGVIVGADYRVLPWLTAGLALSYLGHRIRVQVAGGRRSSRPGLTEPQGRE